MKWLLSAIEALLERLSHYNFLPAKFINYLRNVPLRKKLNAIILFASLPLFAILLFLQIAGGLYVNHQLRSELREAVQSAIYYYDGQKRRAASTAYLAAGNPDIVRELISPTSNISVLLRQGRTILENSEISILRIYNAKGMLLANIARPYDFGDALPPEAPARQALQTGKQVQFSNEEEGVPLFLSAVPVHYNGEVIGVVEAGYRLDTEFARNISELFKKPVFLVRKGKILASSLGRVSDEAELKPEEHFRKILLRKSGKTKRLNLALDSGVMEQGEKSISIILGADLTLAHVLSMALFFSLVVLSLFALFLALAAASKVSRGIASAADETMKGIGKFREGNLEAKIPVNSSDELGRIGEQLNSMASGLDETYSSLLMAQEELRTYADSLEEMVDERTGQLQETLRDVQKLKEQQDGDYFLTSLLLDPLSSVNADHPAVKVDTLSQPKKEFRFGRHERGIGGDYIAADIFHTDTGELLFFINADAMGKSMQGAGGALVLGAALQARLTRLKSRTRDENPDRILRETLQEIHSVFEGFAGRMNASYFAGILELGTGILHYSSGDHPSSVLIRSGGEAEFLSSVAMGAFGGESGEQQLETLQLNPGDVLIAGSDGRSDIILPGNHGIATPFPEEHFLSIVQEANGNLEAILGLIKKEGELSDDFSLLRVEYTGSQKE